MTLNRHCTRSLLLALACLLLLGNARAGKRAPACLKPGELCVPMIRRLIGSQYNTEPYCCNTTCLPLPRPMNGICARFIPQLTGPRTSSTTSTPATDIPAIQRLHYNY